MWASPQDGAASRSHTHSQQRRQPQWLQAVALMKNLGLVLVDFSFFPPRFHSFASRPSVLETKSNTELKIMIPNILIAPFGDKVTGTALYHKTLQPESTAPSTFIFRKTMEEAGQPHIPVIRAPQADILKVLGEVGEGQPRQPAGQPQSSWGGSARPDRHRKSSPAKRGSLAEARASIPNGWILLPDRQEESGSIFLSEGQSAEGGAGRLQLWPAD